MPIDPGSVVTLKQLFRYKRLPRKLPLIYVPKSGLRTLLARATRVKRLSRAGHPIVLTPWPGPGGGVLLDACYTAGPDEVCLPIPRRSRGVITITCQCFPATPEKPERTPQPAPLCGVTILPGGTLGCAGDCESPADRCELVYTRQSNGIVLAECKCRGIRFTPA